MHYDWNIRPLKQMTDAKLLSSFKKAGAYVRSDARQSIRVSKKNSKPGQPPLAKRRTFKNSIFFHATKDDVVTGPIRRAPANSTPEILEAGGYREDYLYNIRKRWEIANGVRQKPKPKPPAPNPNKRKLTPRQIAAIRRKKGQPPQGNLDVKVRFYIAPRPYVKPALTKNSNKIMLMFK